MKQSSVDADRVWTVWAWCSDAYLRYGRKLTMPQGTDPTKTYQWRYVRAIADKFVEWDFDDETAMRFIDIAVRYAKEIGVIHKGLAVLHQTNMLEVCYQRLQAESSENSTTIDALRYVRRWLGQKAGDRDLLEVLLERTDPDGFCNLTLWYQASRLPPLFLCLSRACSRALARLARDCPEERGFLPKQTELFMLRAEFLKDRSNLDASRQIFHHDWREPCLLPS